jgi:hypothetical protein
MALRIRNRWVDLAGPLVLFVVLFAGVLVLLGASFGHAIAYSLTFGAVSAFLDWWHGRHRDVKRRRQQQAIDA